MSQSGATTVKNLGTSVLTAKKTRFAQTAVALTTLLQIAPLIKLPDAVHAAPTPLTPVTHASAPTSQNAAQPLTKNTLKI